jgi:hypothetical protein
LLVGSSVAPGYNACMKNAVVAAVLVLALAAGAQRPTPGPPRADACAVPNQPVAITRCQPASIYVADFDRAAIERILNRHFDGFTILPARGCWHKLCENSVVIQIAGATEPQLRKAAEELRSAGKQESVLLIVPPQPRR